MFVKKCWLVLCLFLVSTLIVYAEEHAKEAELIPLEESVFAYRKGPAISLGAGSNSYALGDVSLTLPNFALEFGYGINERFLASVDLNALLPRIGVGVRYFLKSHDKISFINLDQVQPFVNVGFASFDLDLDLGSEDIGEDAQLSYVVLTGGVGYQWHRYFLTDVSVSLTRFNNVLNVFSVSAMAKVILW